MDDYLISLILILLSATFSGLTLGFLSLHKHYLKRKAKIGDKNAKKIYSVRKNGNLLLCTLLIGNVAVNAALSIYLGSIFSGLTAGLLATAMIVLFGEIIPQAVFSRYAMKIGSKFVWLVKIFIFLLYPVCWPLSKILDRLVGEEMPTIYSKRELAEIIEEHEDSKDSEIDADEERIIKSVLSFSDKTAGNIMTHFREMVVLNANDRVDEHLMKRIRESGHSRIPVYRKNINNIIGILYVKDLIGREDLEEYTAEELARKSVIYVSTKKHLDDLLNSFKKTRNHLFMVVDKPKHVVGLVTIEDVLEELIGEEIIDEFD